jgi:MFS family permease
MAVIGFGMGFLAMPYLVAIQNAVPWNRRGVITSTNQFFRTIGGAIIVAVLGAVLNARLHNLLGPDADASLALHPEAHAAVDPAMLAHVRDALQSGLHSIFIVCVGIGAVALVVAFYFPAGTAAEHLHEERA